VVVAGPNGAGKSTYARGIMADRVPVIDPDRPLRGQSSPVAIGRGALEEVRAQFDRGKSFAVETTLSGKLPRKWVAVARSLGYRVTLYYIALSSAEIAMDRVRRRVAHGGHGVPERDVRRRFTRSLVELQVVAPLVDRLVVLDNSGYPGYKFVLSRERGRTRKARKPPDYLVELVDVL